MRRSILAGLAVAAAMSSQMDVLRPHPKQALNPLKLNRAKRRNNQRKARKIERQNRK